MLEIIDDRYRYSLHTVLCSVLLIAVPATIVLAIIELVASFAAYRLVLFGVLVLGELACLFLLQKRGVEAAGGAGFVLMVCTALVLALLGSPLDIGYYHVLLIATTISGWLGRRCFVMGVAVLAVVVVTVDLLVGYHGIISPGVAVSPGVAEELQPAAYLRGLFFLGLAAAHGLTFAFVLRRLKNERMRLLRELDARELRLREARHRTINGYNQLAAILELELRRPPADQHDALRSVANRVHALGRAAAAIDSTNPRGELDLCRYLAELVQTITDGIGRPEVTVTVDIKGRQLLPGKQAAAVGLVVNEALTNSYKHAFADGRAGTILVEGRRDGAVFTVCIQDDGESKTSPRHVGGAGMGLDLMRALATEFCGTVRFECRDRGAELTITIPTDAPAAAGTCGSLVGMGDGHLSL